MGKGKNHDDLKSVARLRSDTPEIAICAGWRIGAFSDVLGDNLEAESARLNELACISQGQAGFVVYWGEMPAGTCLVVPKEIEPCHPVTPWLAGLFVAGEFRGRGPGQGLGDGGGAGSQATGK